MSDAIRTVQALYAGRSTSAVTLEDFKAIKAVFDGKCAQDENFTQVSVGLYAHVGGWRLNLALWALKKMRGWMV